MKYIKYSLSAMIFFLMINVGPAVAQLVDLSFSMPGQISPYTDQNPDANFPAHMTNNSNQPVTGVVFVQIYKDNVLVVQTDVMQLTPFTLDAGQQMDVPSIETEDYNIFSVNQDNFMQNLLEIGVWPAGTYQICMKIVDPATQADLSDLVCNSFTLQSYMGATPASPADGSTLPDIISNVKLSWNAPVPALTGDIYYELKIYPVTGTQTAGDAVSQNSPILSTVTTQTEYSWSPMKDTIIFDSNYVASDLKYAWTVQAFKSPVLMYSLGTVSPPSSFTISAGANPDMSTWTLSQIVDYAKNTLGMGDEDAQGFGDTKITLSGIQISVRGNLQVTQAVPDCSVGDGAFENGTLDGWNGAYGWFTANGLGLTSQGIDNTRHFIMDKNVTAYDPVVGGTILPTVPPRGGRYSARLGAINLNGMAQSMYYTFNVTSNISNFSFMYAAVLEDPGHPAADQPWVGYQVEIGHYNTSNQWIVDSRPLAFTKIVADRNNPFWTAANNNTYGTIVYKNWTCVPVNLSSYVGKVARVTFFSSGCRPRGHSGYMYVDGLCSNANGAVASLSMNTNFCLSDATYMADGSASTDAFNTFWSVVECDAAGNVTGTEKSLWIGAKPAGTMDIKAMYTQLGGTWKCGQHYKVKIAVQSPCTVWDEKSKIIYIDCATANAGPDKVICSGNNTQIGVASGNYPSGTTFSWSPSTGLSSTTSANPTASPTATTTYTLTTTYHGCSTTDQVVVTVLTSSNFLVSITKNGCFCNTTLTANTINTGGNTMTYAWRIQGSSTVISTNSSITVSPTASTTFVVTVTDFCGHSSTASITVGAINNSDWDHVVAPNVFTPNGDGLNDEFIIQDLAKQLNEDWSYGANEFRLDIYNRWGERLLSNTGSASCDHGIKNGVIKWDGRWKGSVVQQDVYLFILYLNNCAHGWNGPLTHDINCKRSWIFFKKCDHDHPVLMGDLNVIY